MFKMGFYIIIFVLGIVDAAELNSLSFSTKECFLTEPVYDYKFDFSPLKTDFAHIAFSNDGDQFDFNICGNLTKSCDGQKDVSACLTKDNKEYVLGTKQELNYQNGKMFFSYENGSKCPYSNSGENYQLHVVLGCDYSLDKNQSLVTPYSKNACSFYITLETPHACLPEPAEVVSNTCTVKDPQTGHVYDLFPLSDTNYRTTDRQGSAFIINICKPVLYGESAMCPAGSSVCFDSLKSTNIKYRYSDYGTVQANPIIENGHLLMKLSSQSRCNRSSNYTSIIHFYCDMSVKIAHPELIGLNNCVYEFSFITPLACSNLAPCTAVTKGNEILNMSSLMDHPFRLSFQNEIYNVGLCSPAKGPCLEDDGACFAKWRRMTSFGKSNTNLRFNQSGTPYLLYEGGTACQKSDGETGATTNSTWSTKIEFICEPKIETKLLFSVMNEYLERPPEIIKISNCQMLIHYKTELACHEQITCKAAVYTDSGTGKEMVDLTPLINRKENYEAQVDANLIEKHIVGKTTKFFLNICRPLVPKLGLGCPGGSAACMATIDATSPTPEEEKSIGYPLASLVAINRTAAELRYLGGSICATDKKAQMSTGIIFTCDIRAGRGTPILRSINDCHYEFEWVTNAVCPPHMLIFDEKTCEIVNDDIDVTLNLKTALFTDNGHMSGDKGDNYKVDINLCGTHLKAEADYSQPLVQLDFTTIGTCNSSEGLIGVHMRLICSSEKIKYTVFNHNLCDLMYELHTTEICGILGQSSPSDSSTTTETIPAESRTINTIDEDNLYEPEHVVNIGGLLAIILTLVFFTGCLAVVLYSPERRQTIRRFCLRSTSQVRYSRVRSNEEANLLLDPNGEFSDSDDDMLL